MTDAYTQLEALCVQYGFDAALAYDFQRAGASLAQVRAELQRMAALVAEYDRALEPARRAATDARIKAWKAEVATAQRELERLAVLRAATNKAIH